MSTNKQSWEDRIQSYKEHLELLCNYSKKEYCIGCGMTDEFLKIIEQQAYERGREFGFKKENALWLESYPKIVQQALTTEQARVRSEIREMVSKIESQGFSPSDVIKNLEEWLSLPK